MVRTRQGGSIFNFIIIWVVLALLVIGGVYFVRQQLHSGITKTSAPTTSDKSKQGNDKSKNNGTSGSQPAPSSPPASAPAPSQSPTSSAPASPSKTLPQTGPAETLSTVLGVGTLGYITTAYLRSRRAKGLPL